MLHGILERELPDPMPNTPRIAYGVLDPSAFAQDGGPSIAERMARAGAFFRRADNRRVSGVGAIGGWDQVRSRLKGDGEGNPLLVVFSTCRDTIRTVPMMQHDPDRPEDLQTHSEDHVVDEIRYGCMSRPYIRQAPPKVSKLIEFRRPTLNDLLADYDRRQMQIGRI